jgi:hypothetical protein
MLETKIVKSHLRKRGGRLSEEHEKPPGNSGRDGEAGQTAQRGQSGLHRPRQPAGRWFRQTHAGCVLNLKRKTKFFFKEIFPPTTH